MPEQEIKERGGASKWRTIPVGDKGKFMHVAVVKKAGPKGGKTVAGPVRTPKGKPSPPSPPQDDLDWNTPAPAVDSALKKRGY